jgi:hypothetical protein
MKTTLTLLTLFACVLMMAQEPMNNAWDSIHVSDSNYHKQQLKDERDESGIPLPLNAKWIFSFQSVFPTVSNIYYPSYSLSEDTYIHNGNEYHAVLKANHCSQSESQIEGYMRSQDSSWYFTYQLGGNEMLYFKFNATVGELFTGYSWITFGESIVVAAIDSIQMEDGTMRKRIALRENIPSATEYQYWIEGIGSQQMGIAHPIYLGGLWHFWQELRCFDLDGETVFKSVNGPCCLVVGLEEENAQAISVFPVPTDELLNIQLPYADNWSLSLYNMHGSLVNSFTNHGQLTLQLETQHLPVGMYTLQCQDSNGHVFPHKIIKH